MNKKAGQNYLTSFLFVIGIQIAPHFLHISYAGKPYVIDHYQNFTVGHLLKWLDFLSHIIFNISIK